MNLAMSLGDKTLPTTYWDKLLTIIGVAALPLVAMAVLVLRGVTREGARYSYTLTVRGMSTKCLDVR